MRSLTCEGGDFDSLPRRRVEAKKRGRREAGIQDGLRRAQTNNKFGGWGTR